MLKKLSNEQLTKLVLHTTGINSILLEAMLTPEQSPEASQIGDEEIDIDIFVIDPNGESPFREEEPEVGFDMDALCGDWKGGRKKPNLFIFKATPGYMVALGKKLKKDETGDCFLIHNAGGNLCFNAGEGTVYLCYDGENDTIILYPGGDYSRITEKK